MNIITSVSLISAFNNLIWLSISDNGNDSIGASNECFKSKGSSILSVNPFKVSKTCIV